MKTRIALILAALTMFVGDAFAAQVLSRTVTQIAAAAGSPFYITVSGAAPTDTSGACAYNVLFMPDTSTTSGKGIYAILLSAYTQGLTLSRIDYARDGSGNCTLYLVQT